MADELSLEPARPADVPQILEMVRELAAYEKSLEQVEAQQSDLADGLFGPRPGADALVARLGGEPVGFALYFSNYSTWVGRRGLYLEDLYVRPAARGRGVGRALLARLARIAVERGCRRLEWWVLDWNQPARRFYESLGARPMSDWTVHRLSGDALARLADEAG